MTIPFIDNVNGRSMQDTPKTLTGLFAYNKKWVCTNIGPLEKQLTLINNKTMVMIRYIINDLKECKKNINGLSEDELRFAIASRLSYLIDEISNIVDFVKEKEINISEKFSENFFDKTDSYIQKLLSVFDKRPIPVSVKAFNAAGLPLHTFGRKDKTLRIVPRYQQPVISTEIFTVSLISRLRNLKETPSITYLLL